MVLVRMEVSLRLVVPVLAPTGAASKLTRLALFARANHRPHPRCYPILEGVTLICLILRFLASKTASKTEDVLFLVLSSWKPIL